MERTARHKRQRHCGDTQHSIGMKFPKTKGARLIVARDGDLPSLTREDFVKFLPYTHFAEHCISQRLLEKSEASYYQAYTDCREEDEIMKYGSLKPVNAPTRGAAPIQKHSWQVLYIYNHLCASNSNHKQRA